MNKWGFMIIGIFIGWLTVGIAFSYFSSGKAYSTEVNAIIGLLEKIESNTQPAA